MSFGPVEPDRRFDQDRMDGNRSAVEGCRSRFRCLPPETGPLSAQSIPVQSALASPGRTMLALAFAETLVWAGVFYIFPALIAHWEADLGWSKTTVSGAFTAALVTSALCAPLAGRMIDAGHGRRLLRSEEHTSELQSLMRISYAVFCLKKT